jgi:thiamine-monophosphate kinase
MISEREFISRIRSRISPGSRQLVKGIGDDCAVYRIGGDRSARLGLVSADSLIEGVHFDLSWHPPALLGKKAAAVNLSDVAAMGGVPTFILLSLAVAPEVSPIFLDAFVQGFLAQLKKYGVILIGGDTVKSGSEMVISVTVMGEVDEGRVVYRSGAKVGDLVWVSGSLGDAAAGLMICSGAGGQEILSWPSLVEAHLNPEPEVELGRILGESGLVTSMIDMSDGLATDLAHICAESSCGALLKADEIPVSAELKAAAKALKVSSLDLAICGGEDYRLLFTTPASVREELCDRVHAANGRPMFCIGEIVAEPGVILQADTFNKKIDFAGFDHFGQPQLSLPSAK